MTEEQHIELYTSECCDQPVEILIPNAGERYKSILCTYCDYPTKPIRSKYLTPKMLKMAEQTSLIDGWQEEFNQHERFQRFVNDEPWWLDKDDIFDFISSLLLRQAEKTRRETIDKCGKELSLDLMSCGCAYRLESLKSNNV